MQICPEPPEPRKHRTQRNISLPQVCSTRQPRRTSACFPSQSHQLIAIPATSALGGRLADIAGSGTLNIKQLSAGDPCRGAPAAGPAARLEVAHATLFPDHQKAGDFLVLAAGPLKGGPHHMDHMSAWCGAVACAIVRVPHCEVSISSINAMMDHT